MKYEEPLVTFLVLDFLKPQETNHCLQSIKQHVKFPHKVIYLHNGNLVDYPYQLFKNGLVDQLIQTKLNHGQGIGTRDLFAACFSKYAVYMQNDQFLARDWTQEELDKVLNLFPYATSISLCGDTCNGEYSERAHLIQTDFYKELESIYGLGIHGPGPYHDGQHRENRIQHYYKNNFLTHHIYKHPFVVDNGRSAVRQNPDGSIWQHYPDTKGCKLLSGPVKEKFIYPKFTDAEWKTVLDTQSWPDGQIPEQEKPHSFHVWN